MATEFVRVLHKFLMKISELDSHKFLIRIKVLGCCRIGMPKSYDICVFKYGCVCVFYTFRAIMGVFFSFYSSLFSWLFVFCSLRSVSYGRRRRKIILISCSVFCCAYVIAHVGHVESEENVQRGNFEQTGVKSRRLRLVA